MPQYKKTDGAWVDFIVPAEISDTELLAMINDLAQKIADLEKLIQGLAAFADGTEAADES